MKTESNTVALYNTDPALWRNFRLACLGMPYGGAALNVSEDGTVGNGIECLARFASKDDAENTLAASGFHRVSYGWKAKR